MKKILLTAVCLLIPVSPFAYDSFMDKCMNSWVGYPLNSVIKKWGYPDSDKNIAGHKLYIWERSRTVQNSSYETTKERKDSKGRTYYETYTSGGSTEVEYCRRIIEVDENDNVTSGQWKGNDCPIMYFTGQDWVNPENDEWARKKQEKQAQKRGY